MPYWLTWLSYLLGVFWPLYWPVLAAVLLLALLERRFPAAPGQPLAPLLFNLAWYACYLLIFILLSWSAWGGIIDAGSHAFSSPWLRLPPPGSMVAEIPRVALVLLVFDFLAYWLHRLQHAWPAAWAVHRMHHDEQHLNAGTGVRQQWLQIVFVQVAVMLPLAWLFGLEALTPAFFWIPVGVSLWQHMNLRLQMGRLTPLIMGPQLHRLHHSTDERVYNSNFATILPLWDILFGTYSVPARGQFDPTGVKDVKPTRTFGRALFAPLMDWWDMLFQPRGRAGRGRRH